MSGALAWVVRDLSRRVQLFDLPNDRSSHAAPTPRLGGIAMVLGAFGCYLLGRQLGMADATGNWLWGGAAAAAALGFADDLHSLGPALKMLGQCGAAVAALAFGRDVLGLDLAWTALAILSIVAFANIFNFMDGSDGLAAGMAMMFAAGLVILQDSAGVSNIAFSAGLVAAVAAGFLILNWSPASIFMGDAGSLFLGFMLAGMSWQVIAGGVAPIAVALLFVPYIGDTAWTMFQRARRGECIWTAHRSHMYQRLLIAGSSHRSVALLYYAWALGAIQMATSYARGGGAVKIATLMLAVGSVVSIEMFARARQRHALASRRGVVTRTQPPAARRISREPANQVQVSGAFRQ